MALLPYPELDEATLQLPESLNVWKMVAHSPELVAPGIEFASALLRRTRLDPVVRQLLVLAVAREAGAEYVRVQHTRLAADVGATPEQIACVGRGDLTADCFDERQRLAFRALGGTATGLAGAFGRQEIVELLLVIGFYRMMAAFVTTLDVDVDPMGEAISTFVRS